MKLGLTSQRVVHALAIITLPAVLWAHARGYVTINALWAWGTYAIGAHALALLTSIPVQVLDQAQHGIYAGAFNGLTQLLAGNPTAQQKFQQAATVAEHFIVGNTAGVPTQEGTK